MDVVGEEKTKPSSAVGRFIVPRLAPAAIVFVGGFVPIAVAMHFGALGIARNDDGTYLQSAFRLADTGKLNGGVSTTNLVGQLVLSLPVVWAFGHRIAALQIEVAALGVGGLLAVFDFAKQLLSPRRALFVSVMVAVGPMWASLSASYMTDVPGFALAMACLALGARGVRRDGVRVGYLCASLAVGYLGFTIREFAIVAPLAVGIAAISIARHGPRARLAAIAGAVVSVVALAAIFYWWRQSLPGFASPILPGLSLSALTTGTHKTVQSGLLVGILVLPAVVLAGPRRLLRAAYARAPRAMPAVGIATCVGLGGQEIRLRHSAAFIGPGNYVLTNGVLGANFAGPRPDLLPRSLFAILALCGVLSFAVLLCAAVPAALDGIARVSRPRFETGLAPPLVILLLAVLGYTALYVVPQAFGFPVYDRYLLPLVPLVGTLALSPGAGKVPVARQRRFAGCVALLLLAVVGAAYAANSASYDGTKWRVATRVASLAGSPKRVDAGGEWEGYMAGELSSAPATPRRACVLVREEESRPLTADAGVLRVGRVWGLVGPQVWIVARKTRPC